MKKKRIYLDYAAATPLDPYVEKAMRPYAGIHYGNPSSIHEEGRIARVAVDRARDTIADILSVRPDEIIFTGSGTESAALALHGATAAYPGAHIVAGTGEHAAVSENIPMLTRKGYKVTETNHITSGIMNNTVFVSTLYVNNEIGTIQPLHDIAKIIRKERTRRRKTGETLPLFFHTDACQATEYMDLSIPRLGVDLMTLNASKIHGPKGIGMLYVKRGLPLQPFWGGGGQEKNIRSGTEYVAGIVGFAEALRISEKRKIKEAPRMRNLQAYFLRVLKKQLPSAVLNGPPIGEYRVVNNIHISIPGLSGETLVLFLDSRGIAVSTGSACDSQKQELAPRVFDGVRFSLGRHTSKKDIEYVIHTLCDSIKILKRAPQIYGIGKT